MKYYCIGIKGAGMSTLAQILYDLGHSVSGYDDSKDYKFTEEGLRKRGISIYYDGTYEVDQDTIVTYSKAFSTDHPEIQRMMEKHVKIKPYHEIIGDLTKQFSTIAVSGTHGKTTTSSLIAHFLKNSVGCNYFIGDGSGYARRDHHLFVLESCEYNKHFLAYTPTTAIVTNIELEHTECYENIEDIIHTFSLFANRAKKVIACGDDEHVRAMKLTVPVIYYGMGDDNDYIAKNVELTKDGSHFDIYHGSTHLGTFHLPLYGMHMILDFMASFIACTLEGVTIPHIQEELLTFENAKRRFKEKRIRDMILIDDYAHHPTEIKVTIEAARQKYPDKEIVAIFMPNTYSRTKEMWQWFVDVLNLADKAYVTPIRSNRERQEDYEGVSSSLIVDHLSNGKLLMEDDIRSLLCHENSVMCFMSCANIMHLEDEYEKLLLEK